VWAADAIDLMRPGASAADAAERLTALVKGFSERWLSGSITLDRARELQHAGVAGQSASTSMIIAWKYAP
jgi:hypothetical protein